METGHCSNCGKIWTLEIEQGVCQWCNKPAQAQSPIAKPRHAKSNQRRRQKQANGNGNGYDQLDGDDALFYKVAKGFTNKARIEDREDFLHDLFLAFARVKASYTAKGKELTIGGLVRIAQYAVDDYWCEYYYRHNGVSCDRCSKAQKQKCREQDLYGQCPRALQIDNLDRLVTDGNGDSTPLHELIADDKAIDVVARLEARLILDGYPRRFVQIAYKKQAGYQLTDTERRYYWKQQKKAQKSLV